jgi:radical SAM superfamily enzyme YgiQ (UPF0313 family)
MSRGRIGLLAVSGVRIYSRRLSGLGVTLPGFVERAKVIASMPSLGLLTMAAVTPDDYEIEYLECPEFDPEALARLRFDLVGISSFTAKSDVMYRIADFLRARGTTVVLGGLHCTLLPEEAAEHADAVVAGEGELLWPRVLRDWEAGTLRKIYRNGSFHDVDLARTPAPRYDLLDPSTYNRYPVQTTRGCPLHCEFCAASRIYGGYKTKPVEQVVRDLRAAKGAWRHPFIELADDNTFVNKPWSRELVRAIAKEEVHWFTETDVSVADDPELLEEIASSGCRQLLIGLESPNASALRGVELHADWKAKRARDYEQAIRTIQSHGITVNGCFVLGLDSHGPGIFEEVLDFAERTALFEAQVTVLTAFPGTPLYARLLREGRVLEPGRWDLCTLFDVNFQPAGMSPDELRAGIRWLSERLYSADALRRRRDAFFRGLRTKKSGPVAIGATRPDRGKRGRAPRDQTSTNASSEKTTGPVGLIS